MDLGGLMGGLNKVNVCAPLGTLDGSDANFLRNFFSVSNFSNASYVSNVSYVTRCMSNPEIPRSSEVLVEDDGRIEMKLFGFGTSDSTRKLLEDCAQVEKMGKIWISWQWSWGGLRIINTLALIICLPRSS